MIEREPRPEDIRLLEELLHEFNVQATGIADGEWIASFLRDSHDTVVGGIHGWTWGGTCFVRHLFVPAEQRHRGLGSGLMRLVEGEARARGCVQIVLETHDFQAPDFYRWLGFEVVGRVDDYPRGHQYLTMVKHLT